MKIHMVKQGDTLYLIAKKYNVPLEEIIKANPDIGNPDAIEVGMKVKIPSQTKSTLEVIHHHIVQQGDTLWKLSKAWGIQLADMIKANPQLKNPNALLTGEVVNIPKTESGTNPVGNMQGDSVQGIGMHGKANTGIKPGTGIKADTGVQPLATPVPPPVAPIVLPAPTPAPPPPAPPVPPALVMPIPEKPIHGIEKLEHADLFKPYPMPAVQAAANKEMPYEYGMQHQQPMPGIDPAYSSYGYGYGSQQPTVSPETSNAAYGYGHGHDHGYGHGHDHGYGHGYGHQPVISPLGGTIGGDLGGLYGHHDYSYSPPNGQENLPGLMPSGKPASGCKTCGGQQVWPASYEANANAAHYGETYPEMSYSSDRFPYGVSPYAAGPYPAGPYAISPQAVSAYGGYPGTQAKPYYGMPMGDIPLDFKSVAEGFPGAGVGYHPDHYYGGLGAIPPIPTMPPLPPLPPLGPLRENDEQRSDSGEEELTIKSASPKKRQAKPKPKLASVRVSKPKRKESLPWMKW
ncbi:LysM peptidoglycan-binding domain-containing protein [Cohnella luojiensis]|uniref:LysM peptidoglycan-binding domain-containing protein n=1 Tax=Cohnella luojiensis TaxID=652876 RepID=A0A4Y8M4W9_9BACL|nr:LysM peptidoglycan-binding domain-containing protein [Cohnella luojiensis]TFE30716.1 LysM peptidoglycan-binding domain-containing protein [Cohnella luojiensis]